MTHHSIAPSPIVLATFNAKYPHCAFGLRYLQANLGALKPLSQIIELTIHDSAAPAVELLLAANPQVIGFGVYIWNIEITTQVVRLLKLLRPDIKVVLGGPEVSYDSQSLEVVQLADHVISGEADLAFAELCGQLLQTSSVNESPPKFITAQLPNFAQLELPYDLYSDEDVRQRTIYVEASRGCPFTCEFCLSSLEIPVRQVELDRFLAAMQGLLDRGVRQFKFIDRTFNLNLRVSSRILEFFWERYEPGMFLHFEMIPDRLPAGLRTIIQRFPPGVLQFEVGIQSFNEEVAEHISRRQDNQQVEENLTFLREQTGVHVHADLIVGLPGETIESFAAGFDRLIALAPQEIQVGILKRLRGTPIIRHDQTWEMIYSPTSPYEILQNRLIAFTEMQKMRRFARYWDLIGNSGNFIETLPWLWKDASPFQRFSQLSEFIYAREGRTHAVALPKLFEQVFHFMTTQLGYDRTEIAEVLWRDFRRGGRRDLPPAIKECLAAGSSTGLSANNTHEKGLPKRQARHLTSTQPGE